MSKTHKKYESAVVSPAGESEVSIKVTIAAEALAKVRPQALKEIGSEIKIDGFRAGNIPEKVLVSKVGEAAILEESAYMLVNDAYPEILIDHKIDAIGRPDVKIEKLAAGNALEFTLTTAVMPEVKIADYKKIAKEENAKKDEKAEATDKEVEEVVNEIRRSRVDHSSHDHSISMEEHDKLVEAAMPELTEEFAKSMGFESVADMKAKVAEHITADKGRKAKDKKRLALTQAIIDGSEIKLPKVIIENELDRMMAQFESDVARMGAKTEEYLKHIKKTPEDLRKDWRKEAENRAKLQIVLNKIAALEKIEPTEAEILAETDALMKMHKDASEDRVMNYVETMLTNEKIFTFLEEQK